MPGVYQQLLQGRICSSYSTVIRTDGLMRSSHMPASAESKPRCKSSTPRPQSHSPSTTQCILLSTLFQTNTGSLLRALCVFRSAHFCHELPRIWAPKVQLLLIPTLAAGSTLEWNMYSDWHQWLVQSFKQMELDAVVYLRTDPNTCLTRLHKRQRSEEGAVRFSRFLFDSCVGFFRIPSEHSRTP